MQPQHVQDNAPNHVSNTVLDQVISNLGFLVSFNACEDVTWLMSRGDCLGSVCTTVDPGVLTLLT